MAAPFLSFDPLAHERAETNRPTTDQSFVDSTRLPDLPTPPPRLAIPGMPTKFREMSPSPAFPFSNRGWAFRAGGAASFGNVLTSLELATSTPVDISLEKALNADLEAIKVEEERDYHRQSLINGSMLWAHQIWWIIVFIVNLAVYYSLAPTANPELMVDWLAHAAIINLTFVVLVRNELFLCFAYYSFNYIPFLRFYFHRMLHSIGGLHVGCALATFGWITAYVLALRAVLNMRVPSEFALFFTGLLLPVGVISMITFALRPLRERYHDLWEYTHRFIGWSLVADLIVHLGIKASLLTRAQELFTHSALPYLTILIVISVFYIWFTVKLAPIRVTANKHVALIRFAGRPTMADGTFARISRNWWQWHAFSVAFTEENGPDAPQFGVIVGKAGDWTTQLLEDSMSSDPPSKLYIRGVNPPGFMHMHHAYKKGKPFFRWGPHNEWIASLTKCSVVTICTGAGIAPALPHIRQRTSNIFLIWIGKNHRNTYGEDVWASVVDNLPPDQILLHDTGKSGRPDIQNLIIKIAKRHEAEAVFIVSNDPYTVAVMRMCWRLGIRCYGATRDS